MKFIALVALSLSLSQAVGADALQQNMDKFAKSGAKATHQDAMNVLAASLGSIKISKSDMAKMIDQMVSSGQITKKDGDMAKKELNKMSEKDMEKYRMSIMHMMMRAKKPR